MAGVELSQYYRATTRIQFPFYHLVPRTAGVPGTILIAFGRMKDLVDLAAT